MISSKGWKRKTLRIELRKYGHYVSFDLLKSLVDRMPELAAWDSPGPYPEYDAVRPYRPPALKPKEARELAKEIATAKREAKQRGEMESGVSKRERVRIRRRQQLERFLRWYDDPYPERSPKKQQQSQTADGSSDASAVQ